MRRVIAVATAVALAGGATAAFADGLFARASVLSKNQLSISISHSRLGTKKAFKLATDHCASLGRVAVQTVTGDTRGGNAVSTWQCQAAPPSN